MSPTSAPALGVALDTLRANPLRTLLSTLGIVMGAASLAAVLALGDGLEHYARDQLELTTDLRVIAVVPRTTRVQDGVTLPNPGYPVFTAADVAAVRREVPGVGRVAAVLTGSGRVAARGLDPPRAAVVTARPGIGDTTIHRGHEFGPLDSGRVAVVSWNLARALHPAAPTALLGDTLRLEGNAFVVVGIRDSVRGAREFAVEVPLATAPAAMVPAAAPRPPSLMVEAARIEEALAVRAGLVAWLAARDSAWESHVTIQTRQDRLEQVGQGLLVFRLVMGSIAGVSLLVGGIGIMNVLLAAVAERTREIGIRKAAGARGRDILLQFLAESVVISGVGSALGVLLGLGLAYGATALIRARTSAVVYAGVSVGSLAISALAAVAVGLAFGTYPARRAARLSPIEAIRHE